MRNLAKIFAVVLVVAGFGPVMANDSAKQKTAIDIVELFKIEEYLYNITEHSAHNADTHSCLDSTFYPQLKTEFHKYFNNQTKKTLAEKMSKTYLADFLNDVYSFYSNTKVGRDIIQINLNASIAENMEETLKGITPPTEGDIKQAKEYAHGEENYTKLRSFATDFVLKEATLQTKNHDFIRTESVNNLTNSYINSDDTCKKAKQPKQIQTKQLGN